MCCDQCGSENPWNELEWLAEELLDKDDETREKAVWRSSRRSFNDTKSN
jgi:hypothetical protein